jgi:acyl-CoA thioesterase
LTHGLLQSHLELEPVDAGAYERVCDHTWWGHEALFGGYVQGLMLHAMSRELGEPDKPAEAMTMHFIRPFVAPVRFEVSVERTGRSMATVSGRAYSANKLAGLGLASFAVRRPVVEFLALTPPRELTPLRADEKPSTDTFVPTHDHYEFYPRMGSFRRGELAGREARVGGWLRQRHPGPIDHALMFVLADCWMPAAYHYWTTGAPAVTADITAHFRSGFPRLDLDPNAPLFVELRTAGSLGGFVDEDVTIWSEAGELLAQSRQMRFVHAG